MPIDLNKESKRPSKRPDEINIPFETTLRVGYHTVDDMDFMVMGKYTSSGTFLSVINLTKEKLEVELLKRKLA